MKLHFFGAARQVTGSSVGLESGDLRVLVDCGLFQERPALDRNWEPFGFEPETVDSVLLTHAHLDHCGRIPRLVAQGFGGTILATSATTDLAKISLLDSAHIQEEDAAFKRWRHRREGRQGPHPEIPLYTVSDAERCFPHFEPVAYDAPVSLDRRTTVRFREAGHILGSSMIDLETREDGRPPKRVVFSGDIGPWDKPLMRDPSVFEAAEVVVMESTYGDREHADPGPVDEMLAEVIRSTAARGGKVVIPAFAMERAQEVLYYLGRLLRDVRIPELPVFLDSPMAVEVTRIFSRYPSYLDEEARALLRVGKNPLEFPGLRHIRTVEESKAVNRLERPCVILAGSGMATAGRVKHHLANLIERPSSTILFVGYQAPQTLGRLILDGAAEVRILGRTLKVRARVARINGFSGHAGRSDLLRWLGAFRRRPTTVFLGHGEESTTLAFAAELGGEGWSVVVPRSGEVFDV